MMKQKLSSIVIGIMLSIVVAAETLITQREATLRPVPDPYVKAIQVIPKGASLEVLEKDTTFAKVQWEGVTGWVRLKDIQTTSARGRDASAVEGVRPSGQASEVGAGKGLGDRAEAYGKATGGDPKQVDALIRLRQQLIDSGAWAQWAQQGNVGSNRREK
jgi:hypothetical protein